MKKEYSICTKSRFVFVIKNSITLMHLYHVTLFELDYQHVTASELAVISSYHLFKESKYQIIVFIWMECKKIFDVID